VHKLYQPGRGQIDRSFKKKIQEKKKDSERGKDEERGNRYREINVTKGARRVLRRSPDRKQLKGKEGQEAK